MAGKWSAEDAARGLSPAYGEGRMVKALVTAENLARRDRAALVASRLHASLPQASSLRADTV